MQQAHTMTESDARAIADDIATAELREVEKSHPGAHLPLGDYKVTPLPEENGFHFLYNYAGDHHGFIAWLGHGMHFSVLVHKDGSHEMIPGE